MKQKIVALTGAGISAESGLETFRGTDGLWEGHNIYDVATPEAWERNPVLVQDFYNHRRRQVLEAEPNLAHQLLAHLEQYFEVDIITQNIDNLHERAGSTRVTHLHGIISKSQSSINPNLVYPINGTEIKMGQLCEMGSQLRPHVVWFGEAVPMIQPASLLCKQPDIFIIVGTSLAVYPAAGLIDYVPAHVPKYIIDPNVPDVKRYKNLTKIEKNAISGMEVLYQMLLNSKA